MGHSDSVTDVAFSAADSGLLASGSMDNTVQLWDVGGQRQLAVLSGHAAPVSSVAFNPNGMLLASADSNGVVKVWDIASRTLLFSLATLDPGLQILGLSFSPDGDLLSGGSMAGYLIRRRRSMHSSGSSSSSSSSRSGSSSGGSGSPPGSALDPLVTHGSDSAWFHAAWVRERSGGGSGEGQQQQQQQQQRHRTRRSLTQAGESSNLVVVWSVNDRAEVARLRGHTDAVAATAFAPGSRNRLASCSADGTIRVWETKNWRPVAVLLGQPHVSDCAWDAAVLPSTLVRVPTYGSYVRTYVGT
ncbi:hypothetical protein FOA52_005485 [Chlamydomonas sp. UWO 241]|nr:hypothetical protein FOA52_005485 [Chlamydomonas sp. UWO 241]